MQIKMSDTGHRVAGVISRPVDKAVTGQPKGQQSFAKILEGIEKTQPVTFSKHAAERLRSCGEPLDSDKLSRLEGAMQVASEKGARSTLVLMKGLAFVVAPQSGTVVTVIPEGRMKEHVFTSIDSAVLVDR
jgi:flagellar operon protein